MEAVRSQPIMDVASTCIGRTTDRSKNGYRFSIDTETRYVLYVVLHNEHLRNTASPRVPLHNSLRNTIGGETFFKIYSLLPHPVDRKSVFSVE